MIACSKGSLLRCTSRSKMYENAAKLTHPDTIIPEPRQCQTGSASRNDCATERSRTRRPPSYHTRREAEGRLERGRREGGERADHRGLCPNSPRSLRCRHPSCCSTCPSRLPGIPALTPQHRKMLHSSCPVHVAHHTRAGQRPYVVCHLRRARGGGIALRRGISSSTHWTGRGPACGCSGTHGSSTPSTHAACILTHAVPVDTPLPMAPRSPPPLNPVAVPKIHPMIHGPMKPLTVAPRTCTHRPERQHDHGTCPSLCACYVTRARARLPHLAGPGPARSTLLRARGCATSHYTWSTLRANLRTFSA
jgi:hypothetical protein